MKKTIYHDNMFQSIILCGGSGTRLWPLSQKEFPKQFTTLFGNKTLLQETYDRCQQLSDYLNFNTKITILTLAKFKNLVQIQLGSTDIPLILEKEPRDTAAAVCMSALKSPPDDFLLICPADHYIPDNLKFIKSIQQGIPLAENGSIVTFGIVPTYPETGYGYIESDNNDIIRFCEKPDFATAEKFISSEKFYWNSGIFLAKAKVFLEEFQKYAPDILEACLNTNIKIKNNTVKIGSNYHLVPKLSIDYAIMEKTLIGKIISSKFIWSDVGSWKSVYQISNQDENNNSSNELSNFVDSDNCYSYTTKPVTFLGLKNIGLIETNSQILVLNLDQSQKVKNVAK